MKLNEQRMRAFYFGGLSEMDRLEIEREMLEDTEVLLDYLDLKRTIESADQIPSRPSAFLWSRLRLSPSMMTKKAWWISLGAGAAVAACLALFMMKSMPLNAPSSSASGNLERNEILFDSSAEQSAAANVL